MPSTRTRPDVLSRDELQFVSELRLGILHHLGDVPPDVGLGITYAPSRLAGRDGVPIQSRGRGCDRDDRLFCGDDSDGSDDFGSDFSDDTDFERACFYDDADFDSLDDDPHY